MGLHHLSLQSRRPGGAIWVAVEHRVSKRESRVRKIVMLGSSQRTEPLDIPAFEGLSLDGNSFGTDQANKKALEERDSRAIALQVSEFKRKIERQDGELKKAARDSRALQRDILTLNNQLRESKMEIKGLQGDKEALSNALKVANAKVIDEKPYETQARLDANRIRELEDTVLMTQHKFIKLEESVEREKMRNSELKVDLDNAETERDSFKVELDALRIERDEFPAKM